jgi:hypothetical protein
VTGKGQRLARATRAILGNKYLAGDCPGGQEATACSASAQRRLSIPPRTQEEHHKGMPVVRGDLLDLI